MARISGTPNGANSHYGFRSGPHRRLEVSGDLAIPHDLLEMIVSTSYATLGQPLTPSLDHMRRSDARSSYGSVHLLLAHNFYIC